MRVDAVPTGERQPNEARQEKTGGRGCLCRAGHPRPRDLERWPAWARRGTEPSGSAPHRLSSTAGITCGLPPARDGGWTRPKLRVDEQRRPVVLVTADHGYQQDLNGTPPLGTLNLEAIRIPGLLILPDGRAAGTVVEELFTHTDPSPALTGWRPRKSTSCEALLPSTPTP